MLTTVLTRSIVSFFSEGVLIGPLNIEKRGNSFERVFLGVDKEDDVQCLLDRDFYVEVEDLRVTEKIKNAGMEFYKASEEHSEFGSDDVNDLGKTLVLQDTLKEKKKIYVETVMECAMNRKVYIDVLEVGLIHYILYSHRSNDEYRKDNKSDMISIEWDGSTCKEKQVDKECSLITDIGKWVKIPVIPKSITKV